MPKKQKPPQSAPTSSIIYYFGRVLHRTVLCITITLTGLYWTTLVVITALAAYSNNLMHNELRDSYAQNETINLIVNGIQANAIKWAVFAAAISLLLLTIARFRKYDKPVVVDGVVIALFCLVSALLAENIVRLTLTVF